MHPVIDPYMRYSYSPEDIHAGGVEVQKTRGDQNQPGRFRESTVFLGAAFDSRTNDGR